MEARDRPTRLETALQRDRGALLIVLVAIPRDPLPGVRLGVMLMLFAGGVMNLVVILALTAWVLVEKLAPFGERTATASGILLLAVALWIGLR
jgi:predicted metal-binding membrane protein